MGVGHGKGDNRAKEAVTAAIESPLLETTISGARAILLYVSGGYDLGMLEVNEIASMVEEQADREAILIFGAAVSEEMNDEIAITVIATGFGEGLDSVPLNYSNFGRKPQEVVTGFFVILVKGYFKYINDKRNSFQRQQNIQRVQETFSEKVPRSAGTLSD